MGSRVVCMNAHHPRFLGGLEKVVEALAVYHRALGRDVAVLTSRGQAHTADCPGGAGLVPRLRSRKMAKSQSSRAFPASFSGFRADFLVTLRFPGYGNG